MDPIYTSGLKAAWFAKKSSHHVTYTFGTEPLPREIGPIASYCHFFYTQTALCSSDTSKYLYKWKHSHVRYFYGWHIGQLAVDYPERLARTLNKNILCIRKVWPVALSWSHWASMMPRLYDCTYILQQWWTPTRWQIRVINTLEKKNLSRTKWGL